jgi:hypothetical protein
MDVMVAVEGVYDAALACVLAQIFWLLVAAAVVEVAAEQFDAESPQNGWAMAETRVY